MSKLLDDIIICVTVVLCLAIALFLAFSMVERQRSYPPSLITLFLGISVAALTYRFLGGAGETKLSLGLLQLGGSAALMLGITFIMGDRLRDEFNILADSGGYIAKIAQLDKDADRRANENMAKDQRIQELETRIDATPSVNAQAALKRLRELDPQHPVVVGIRAMMSAQEGPFRQTLRDMEARVALVKMPRDGALYNICPDTAEELYRGFQANDRILVSRSVGTDAEEVSALLVRKGRIGLDICRSASRNFDVQIGCGTARKLFPELAPDCADGPSIRGQRVVLGALP